MFDHLKQHFEMAAAWLFFGLIVMVSVTLLPMLWEKFLCWL